MKIPESSYKFNSDASQISDLVVSDAERLNTWLPEIAAALRPGSPVKAQPDGSVRVGNKGALSLGPAPGLWFEHSAVEGGRDAFSLIRYLGTENPSEWANRFLSDHEGTGSLSGAQDEIAENQNEASRLAMAHFVNQSKPIEGTPAEAYLQGRGIKEPYPDNIRYVAEARVGEGAMVAVVNGPEGPVAAQLTYLTPDGNKSTVAPQRRLFTGQPDWQASGGLVLTDKGALARTVIAEGVEDALSLRQAGAGATVIASLARQLKGVVIGGTKTMRNGSSKKKGYSRAAFTDAWERYGITSMDGDACEKLSDTTVATVATGQPLPSNGYGGTDVPRLSPDATDVSRLSDDQNPSATAGCHGATDATGGNGAFSETPIQDADDDDGGDACLL
jgi:hypothetical protein